MISRIAGRVLMGLAIAGPALAGPPFRTDDPEPVPYRHGEAYLATQGHVDRQETALTAPHVECNYGLMPNVQIHLLAPCEYVKPTGGPSHYGIGDLELGAKIRFIQESGSRPQVGIFPLLILPTGDEDEGLGSGEVQAFLPLWLQKSWGPWSSYGGGGYWINPGAGHKDYWFFGWEVQRELTKHFTLGAEVFHQTPGEAAGDSSTGFNVGAIVNISDAQHVLLTAGRNIAGPNSASFYVGYQLTFGP